MMTPDKWSELFRLLRDSLIACLLILALCLALLWLNGIRLEAREGSGHPPESVTDSVH